MTKHFSAHCTNNTFITYCVETYMCMMRVFVLQMFNAMSYRNSEAHYAFLLEVSQAVVLRATMTFIAVTTFRGRTDVPSRLFQFRAR
jgi:hypothetical protein